MLSFQGERILSPQRRFQETILVVGFFGSTKSNLRRHVDFFSELGYDCVLFELKDAWYDMRPHIKHLWAGQITQLLNETPGDKIIFAFSNPSSGAIQAIAERQAKDVSGLVCDSGPTAQPWQAMLNYFTHAVPLKYLPLRLAAATVTSQFALRNFLKQLHHDLNKIPKGFALLSIRGWKDKIITPKMIDLVFDEQTHLDYQKLSLPEADHVTGLKDYPEEYKPAVSKFLLSISKTV